MDQSRRTIFVASFVLSFVDVVEDEDEGATAPFIVPPTRHLKPHWTPPSLAVVEKSSRPDLSFLYGGGPPGPFRLLARPAPDLRRIEPNWTPPSPAVGENARRYDALFATGEDARLQITFVAIRKESALLASRRRGPIRPALLLRTHRSGRERWSGTYRTAQSRSRAK